MPAIAVHGIDFCSTPTRAKPIMCLDCRLEHDVLRAGRLRELTALDAFEAWLARPGPWIAGLDLPFGQSRRFVENIGWPATWAGYVDHAGTLSRQELRAALEAYRGPRAAGDREHRRRTDVAAGAISPQKLHGVPVGLMFHEGAPRLRRAGVTVPGLQSGDSERIVVEAYPGVLARRLIGRRSYKSDTRSRQGPERLHARRELLEALLGGALRDTHGLRVEAPLALADDPKGDALDALLCAVQAAWAWTRRDARFGEPEGSDPLEGWIAEPTLVAPVPDEAAAHAARMREVKKVQRAKVAAAKDPDRGLVLVHTGNGKGKSSSAFGVVARALGWGQRVAVVQFIKGTWKTGEKQFFARFADELVWHTMGEGFTWETQDRERDIAAARAAFDRAAALLSGGDFDLVVLDEIHIALRYDYLDGTDVVAALEARAPRTGAVLTGRDAPQALIDYADCVTEMREIKHPFKSGVRAQKGIDF